MPGTVLGARDTTMNKQRKLLSSLSLHSTEGKQTAMYIITLGSNKLYEEK